MPLPPRKRGQLFVAPIPQLRSNQEHAARAAHLKARADVCFKGAQLVLRAPNCARIWGLKTPSTLEQPPNRTTADNGGTEIKRPMRRLRPFDQHNQSHRNERRRRAKKAQKDGRPKPAHGLTSIGAQHGPVPDGAQQHLAGVPNGDAWALSRKCGARRLADQLWVAGVLGCTIKRPTRMAADTTLAIATASISPRAPRPKWMHNSQPKGDMMTT
ncbi:MAG: hypothetical protein RLZZ157_308 [Pseudomonadota bacterium]